MKNFIKTIITATLIFGLQNVNAVKFNMFGDSSTGPWPLALYAIPKDSDQYKNIIQANNKISFDKYGRPNPLPKSSKDIAKSFNYTQKLPLPNWMSFPNPTVAKFEEKVFNAGEKNCFGICWKYFNLTTCNLFSMFCEDIYALIGDNDYDYIALFLDKYPKDISGKRKNKTEVEVKITAPQTCKDIAKATYGVGDKQKDVTSVVKGKEFTFSGDMNRLGDPAKGEAKILQIECVEKNQDGTPRILEFNEKWEMVKNTFK